MRKLIYNFIIDRLVFISGYFFNSLLLILFFYLYTGKVVEVIYPLILSLFIFIIIIMIQWHKYYSFAKNIFSSVSNPYYYLDLKTLEQKDIKKVIDDIHSNYLLKIDTVNKDNLQRNHFFSQWVHMMKTPVSIIDIVGQKYMRSQIDAQEAIEDILIENNKLLSGLEQMLGIVRLENFSKDYLPEAIDLVTEVRSLVNQKKNNFIHNNVFPRIRCSNENIVVFTDKKWNGLLIEQIISNAIKYSQAKGESKYIFFDIEQWTDCTTLTIIDQGIGIPQHDLSRIFEPFFTGDNGRKVKNSTGIGLHICSQICEKMGHKLSVKSSTETGTEVTISYLTKM